MYKAFIIEIPSGDNDFLSKSKNKLELSSVINQPQLKLGFHYFLHRTKNSMEITNNYKNNKFYLVVNEFEHKINNNDDISKYTKTFFSLKDVPILSRAFYKMWEILFIFDLFDNKKESITVGTLAEGPGSFLQAILLFREKFGKGYKKDKYNAVTLYTKNNLELDTKFLKKYGSVLTNLKTVEKPKNKNETNGDLTSINTSNLFKKQFNNKYADLVTADGGFVWNNENYQEQEAYRLILGEIIAALKIQKKDGAFVLKIFETFTDTSLKILYILTSFYKENYIHKPFFSRPSNSEKYVICKGFKYDQDKDKKILEEKISSLEYILENSKEKFIRNIYSDLKLPKEFTDRFTFLNINIANKQQIMINKIITYIKNNDYFGDDYHTFISNQIKASKWWLSIFYNLKSKVEFDKIIKKEIDDNNKDLNNFRKELI